MALRSQSLEALILHTRESPSGGRFVSCLTRELGLVDCFLFGGGRSKLRSMAVPWHRGTILLYSAANNELTKITDFEPESLYAEIRKNYETIILATWASELMLATHGLGGLGFPIMAEVLESLDARADGATSMLRVVKLVFAAKVLDAAGALPELSGCAHCTGKSAQNALQYYSPAKSGFVCEACREEGDEGLSVAALSWLYGNLDKPMAEIQSCAAREQELAGLEACCMELLVRMTGKPIRTALLLGN